MPDKNFKENQFMPNSNENWKSGGTGPLEKTNIERVIEEILSDERRLPEFLACEDQDELYRYCLERSSKYTRKEFDEFVEKIKKASKEIISSLDSEKIKQMGGREHLLEKKIRQAFTKVLAAGLAVFSVASVVQNLISETVAANVSEAAKNKKLKRKNNEKNERNDSKKLSPISKVLIPLGLGATIGGILATNYESILNHNYLKNKANLDIDESDVKKLTQEQRLEKFQELSANFRRIQSCSGTMAIFYSIADAVLFRNAKKMQDINAKRMIAFNKGLCRNYATLASYWLDKLEIPNHIVVYKTAINNPHVSNVYYNITNNMWKFVDLTAIQDQSINDYLLGGRVLESSSNWGKKSQKNLMTVNCQEFIEDPSGCKYDTKLGDYLDLLKELLHYYS